jgi:hypothetical protein
MAVVGPLCLRPPLPPRDRLLVRTQILQASQDPHPPYSCRLRFDLNRYINIYLSRSNPTDPYARPSPLPTAG